MKTIVLLMLMILFVSSCKNVSKKSELVDFCISIDSVIVLDNLKLLERYEFTVLYENKGTEVIKLKSVDTFCGCLTENNLNNIVLPGETGCLIFSYLPQDIGYMERCIFLYFDNQKEPVCFRIKGIVKAIK